MSDNQRPTGRSARRLEQPAIKPTSQIQSTLKPMDRFLWAVPTLEGHETDFWREIISSTGQADTNSQVEAILTFRRVASYPHRD